MKKYCLDEIVEKIVSFFYSNENKGKIYIPTGFGKTNIIVSSIQTLLRDNVNTTVAVLMQTREQCEQVKLNLLKVDNNIDISLYTNKFYKQNILITTYKDIFYNDLDLNTFNLIICNDLNYERNTECFDSLYTSSLGNTKLLAFLNEKGQNEHLFKDARCLFKYTFRDAIKDGYNVRLENDNSIESFLVKLLQCSGYENIEIKDSYKCKEKFDIIANKDDEDILFWVKSYRSLYNSKIIINNALRQIVKYKYWILKENNNRKKSFILILTCEIDEKTRNEIYNCFNIIIWDINNLIYLCKNQKELLRLLTIHIPYSFSELKAQKPLDYRDGQLCTVDCNEDCNKQISIAQMYLEKLELCKTGKLDNFNREYENICTEIIKYLFETEFLRTIKEHSTDDKMFRMDLLCSLKGSTEFWKFLISFYHTKFVVFEYKNYSDYISQNLVYTTEKYLFSVALRNVAFIISRKGFDKNAEKAALGCLKENGKLIISLNDDDLIKMISIKENGEDPSDYLMKKVEDMLMSVSK